MTRASTDGGTPARSTCAAAGEIIAATDRICAEHLDAEYAELCRKLIGKLARKRPSPLVRGEPRVWVGAVIYTVGMVNFLFDKTQRPHMTTGPSAPPKVPAQHALDVPGAGISRPGVAVQLPEHVLSQCDRSLPLHTTNLLPLSSRTSPHL